MQAIPLPVKALTTAWAYRLPATAALATAYICHNPSEKPSIEATEPPTATNGLKTAATYAIAIPIATLSGITAHEMGHAIAGSIAEPGSLKMIQIGLSGGECEFHFKRVSRLGLASMIAAGPAAGLSFSYAGIKGLQVWDEYKKTNDLNQAIQTAKEKPLLATSDSTVTKALQHGLIFTGFCNALNCIAARSGPFFTNDGTLFYQNLFLGNFNKALPRRLVFLWNTALLVGTGYAVSKMKDTYTQYEEKKNRQNATAAVDTELDETAKALLAAIAEEKEAKRQKIAAYDAWYEAKEQ
jgi:hypothetical protein